jgi:hypothetical protein
MVTVALASESVSDSEVLTGSDSEADLQVTDFHPLASDFHCALSSSLNVSSSSTFTVPYSPRSGNEQRSYRV